MTTADAPDLRDVLERIRAGLEAAREVLTGFTPGAIASAIKSGTGDPVTAADLAVDAALKTHLLRDGEGWLSEETADDLIRLEFDKVWIVDPIDGTKEFVKGIPEWCVSIGYCVGGRAVAGGILNPETDELILGAVGHGVTLNGKPVTASTRTDVAGASVLASRSEIRRGEWAPFEALVDVVACGSVAYKLGLVAAGKADATWTLVPKSEWDVAAGLALLDAAGAVAWIPSPTGGRTTAMNQRNSLIPGLVVCAGSLEGPVRELIAAQGR